MTPRRDRSRRADTSRASRGRDQPARLRSGRPARLADPAVTPPPAGGAYRPLSDADRDRIVDHAFAILEAVGMAGAPDRYARLLVEAGAARRPDGRLLLGRPMVEAALARSPSTVELPGFSDDRCLSLP